MSLYKVLSKSGLMTQEVKAAASGGGSFVWGKEGFKWIVGAAERSKTHAATEKETDYDHEAAVRDNRSTSYGDTCSNIGDKAYK